MSLSMPTSGSMRPLSFLTSATTPLAASWSFQKPSLPILSSSSFRRASLVGKSKRVPDGDHPGAEGFDGLREVFVDHGLRLGGAEGNSKSSLKFSVFSNRL